jgi:hypothetical protein
MALNPDDAARIAAKHGLGLADAVSLRGLADDEATADRLAAQFAGSGDTRQWLRHLFADPEAVTPAPVPEPSLGNHVPHEGSNADATSNDDADQRQFVRALFGYDH